MLASCGSSSTANKKATTTTTTATTTATVVNVTLADTAGLKGPMTTVVAPASVPAGKVKFVVKNAGTIQHELIVLKSTTPFDQLPIVDANDPPVPVSSGANKVSEATSVGESGNVDVGKTKSVTLDLKTGSYVLVCNIAQHYGLGMRAAFSVT